MDLISSAFVVLGLVVIGCLIAIGVIVVQAFRSVKIGEQLYLPLTAEDYTALDDACVRAARERLSDE